MGAPSSVAVFGGAFDPPHNGHLMVIGALLDYPGADEVWLVPSGTRGDKGFSSSSEHRLALARLLVEEAASSVKPVRLCTVEFDAQGAMEGTVELFRLLRSAHPEVEFSFVVGSDLLSSLPSWRHPEQLRSEVPFLALVRADEAIVAPEGFDLTRINQPFTSSLSSTQVRQAVRSGGSLCGMTPARIARYIERHTLYS